MINPITSPRIYKSLIQLFSLVLLLLLLFSLTHSRSRAATPGLPFTEDFSDTNLQDPLLINANWSTEEEALILSWRRVQFGAGLTGSDTTTDAHSTFSVVLGDVDGDGDLDLIVGNYNQVNRLYLNNGTANPFNGVSGVNITADTHATISVVLGDVDGDGDLDLIVGNDGQVNRLYLNNGTANPFNGISGTDISTDVHNTASVVLGDVDGDGDIDLIAGNYDQANRLYLNNGTADPFNGISGTDITADTHSTISVALGDVDGDGDLDLIVGNYGQVNRLYLNNGGGASWSAANITGDAHNTFSVAVGDVDGDGDLDLVVGNDNQANRLYLNNGTADPFSGVSGTAITADAHHTYTIALADVDGDGDLDLIAGNWNQANRLYRNNGTADPFNGVSGSDLTTDTHATRSVALGDVDGDGDVELIVGNDNGQTNRLYLNNGNGNPWNGVSGSNITADTYNTYAVALGDVDGDGDLDLIVGNYNLVNLLYLNNGTANPFNGVSGISITADVHNTTSVVLGDVDDDGDLDLIVGNWGQVNRLYLNNGTADPFNGVSGTNITVDVHNTMAVALGDVDRDGDLDLIVGNFGALGEVNRLYLNNGTSNPFNGVSGTNITNDSYRTWAVVLGDVDGDGDLDLVVGNAGAGGQVNRLYLNNGTADPFSGVSGSNITNDVQHTRSVTLGDVDGDGDLDLIAGNDGQINRLYLNNGTAAPFNGITGTNITNDSQNTYSVTLGDVDGDGDLDLVAGTVGAVNRLYLNNGTADPFSGVGGISITGDFDTTRSVALGDVDGDGDLDLIAGNNNQAHRLYLNNSLPAPAVGFVGSALTPPANATLSVALGDVDGDGDLDLIAGNYNNQTNQLYLNNGLSAATDPFHGVSGVNITADTHNTASVALGDVDGDGDLDLIVGNWNQANRLYLNNGTANPFNGVSGIDITADVHSTISVALGDVDGDGDLDLIVGNYSQVNRLYLNNGTANPFNGVSGISVTADTHQTFSVALGDVDGDGDLDLIVGNQNQANRLYLNNGTTNPFNGVSGVNITADTHQTFSVALGDVDRDGDLDLIVGNWNQANRLYRNNGTANPFNGVSGIDITSDTHQTYFVSLGDVDRDGNLDLIVGNENQANMLYLMARPTRGMVLAALSSPLTPTIRAPWHWGI